MARATETEDNVISSEHAFFEESDEVLHILRDLIACEDPEVERLPSNVEKVVKVFEKYQEQCSLLDPHLEGMMDVLTTRSRVIMLELFDRQRSQHDDGEFIFQCEKNPQQVAIFKIIYNLCRCRGFKTVVKFFPHEVSDLEPMMFMLQSQDRNDCESWESRYSLLLWLSMLVLIPFDIYTIDSSLGSHHNNERSEISTNYYGQSSIEGLDGLEGNQTLVGLILSLCRDYMTDSGPTRDAAAVCLSSLLTRPDMDEHYFLKFIAWAGAFLSQENLFRTTQNMFLVTGVLMTLTSIFKKGHRDHLLGVVQHLFPHILYLARHESSSTLLRKLLVKLFQRMGMAFLPPRVVSWAYQRGQRSLLQNLSTNGGGVGSGGGQEGGQEESGVEEEESIWVPDELEDIVEQLLVGLRDRDTIVRWSAAKGIGRITSRLPKHMADDVVVSVLELFSDSEGDGAWHGGCLALAELSRRGLLLPFRLPEAVPVVVKAIQYDVRRGSNSVGAHVRDAACYVCWAFARAYSPTVMNPHVDQLCEGMLLAALFDREINCRRAAAAAFQENVGRQGHLNFPHGIDILTAADYFTLGVRSNAYMKISTFVASFEKYRKPLISHIYNVKLFHWDIQIRDLASKTLYLMTELDPDLIANHAIPTLLPYTTSPDLLKRHGAILGIAESLKALSSLNYSLTQDVISDIISIVPQIEKARLYRGRGGEIVRQACCRLLECIALAKLPLPVKMQLRLLDSIDESIKHAMEPVQLQAVAALRVFMRSYFPVNDLGLPSPRLQTRVVDKYCDLIKTADIASLTRGFALALGCLPKHLISFSLENLNKVTDILCYATQTDFRVGDEPDAETRRNAITALVEVYCEVGPMIQEEEGGEEGQEGDGETIKQVTVRPKFGFSAEKTTLVFETLMTATKDYSMDKRGDVGSWSRIAAMEGLEKVMLSAHQADLHPSQRKKEVEGVPTVAAVTTAAEEEEEEGKEKVTKEVYVTKEMITRMVATMLKQLCEKLDNVRSRAGAVLERLLNNDTCTLSHLIPQRNELRTILFKQNDENDLTVNWGLASETFPKMVKVMELSEYHNAIVSGLILSVGGLTEAVVKSSSKSLLEWTRNKKKQNDVKTLSKLSDVLLSLFLLYPGEDRVILPLMKTIELLLENEIFDFLCATSTESATSTSLSSTTELAFGEDLLMKVKKELYRSTNVVKLFTSLNIALTLLRFISLKPLAFELVLELLGHRYPRVRKHSAEQFHTKLFIDETLVNAEVYDLVLDILRCTVWDADVTSARQERDSIASAVGVRMTEIVSAPKKAKAKAKDELDSYQHLVNEVGY